MKVRAVKCPCGYRGCNDWHLKGFGKFVQGSGFTKTEAIILAYLINGHKSYINWVKNLENELPEVHKDVLNLHKEKELPKDKN